jgi:hypothetical protein
VGARELFRDTARLIQGGGQDMSSDIFLPMLVKPEAGGGGAGSVLHHSALGGLESGGEAGLSGLSCVEETVTLAFPLPRL